jgi:predicted aldo/keto reductase-like oxidoreductase
MANNPSRRTFIATGLAALPTAALASKTASAAQAPASADAPVLKYRMLGRTGLKVTSVGFGCMITSDPSVITKAADLGINYFDTARGYQGGNNEPMVGAALGAKRKDVVLSSKSKGGTMADLEESLRQLKTDHLDIWYFHAKSQASEITDEWLEVQRKAKQEGKIRFAGVSTHSGQADIGPAIVAHKDDIDVVLTSYNFSMDPGIEQFIDALSQAGIGIVAMKVMAGGFRRARPGEKTAEILKRKGAMPAALRWTLKNQKINTTIPSITDMEQLDENIRCMDAAFAEGDKETLAYQLEHIRPLYCRSCGNCSGVCPQGLPVSDMLRIASYVDGYGEYQLARERFQELPSRVQAVRCNLCPTCSINCPNGVLVSARLARAQEMLA